MAEKKTLLADLKEGEWAELPTNNFGTLRVQGTTTTQPVNRGLFLPELEDYFSTRLDAQWRMDRNSVTLAGSGVSSVVERITTRAARSLVQATDSKRPSYHSAIPAMNNCPAIGDAGVGAGHTKVLTCADASIALANPYARFVVFAPRVSMVGADVRLIGSADANRFCEIDINGSYYAYEGAGSTASIIATPNLASLLGHLLVVNPQDNANEQSNGWLFRADGKLYRATGLGSVTGRGSGDIAVLSWNVTSGLGAPAYIADVGQITGTIRPLDRVAILEYANARYGYAMPNSETIVDGNSIVVGAASQFATMLDALSVNSAWANVAVSGRTTPIVAEALPFAQEKYSVLVSGIRRAYCFFEITNDISQYTDGSPAAVAANTTTVYNNVVALIAQAKNQGFTDIFIGTCLARGTFTVPNGQELIRQNVNTLLVNNRANLGVTLVNLHTLDPIDGQSCPAGLLNPADPAFFNVDQTHLVAAGSALFVGQYGYRLVGKGY